ncbi:MAG: hypothetical protein EOP04_02205 [Proteobacteria bacterium]|nr:MAG: hypothetical protein EOP04_02205 [Pseudomonadota bacterium]
MKILGGWVIFHQSFPFACKALVCENLHQTIPNNIFLYSVIVVQVYITFNNKFDRFCVLCDFALCWMLFGGYSNLFLLSGLRHFKFHNAKRES